MSYADPVTEGDDLTPALKKLCYAVQNGGGSGSGVAWGSITGTLSNQTDLAAAIAAATTAPAGSDGQLQYNNGGVFGGAASTFFNDLTGYVGLGTILPTAPLTVGDLAGGVGKIQINISSDQNSGGTVRPFDITYFNGNNCFRVDLNGNAMAANNFTADQGGFFMSGKNLFLYGSAASDTGNACVIGTGSDANTRQLQALSVRLLPSVGGTAYFNLRSTGLNFVLPTSSAGLSSGDWYTNLGVVMINP